MNDNDKLQIEVESERLPKLIKDKSDEITEARKIYLTAKAEYENKYFEIYLSVKIQHSDKTQGDLKADATIGSHLLRLDMILKESKYKKLINECTHLKDQFSVYMERSYTYRQEIKRGL